MIILIFYRSKIIKIRSRLCPEHGEFYQTIVDHLKFGCKKCSRKFMDLQLFINTANEIHNNKYDYSLVDYRNNHTKIKIICKKHGIFEQRPNDHLMKHGCPHCNESQGELKIAEYLDNNSILYERQKTFIDCKNIKKLPFDFFLPDFNICIEYDGFKFTLNSIEDIYTINSFFDILSNSC